jgi:hypothetical protein
MCVQLRLMVEADPVRQVHVWPGDEAPVGGRRPGAPARQGQVGGQAQLAQHRLQVCLLLAEIQNY